nr:E3 ubiquitin-protein ligase MBR2-like [Ipomoea batatas]
MPDPVENQLSNSVLAASGGNTGGMNAPSFSDWDPGEPNSSRNVHSHVHGSNLEVRHGWSSSSSNCVVADPMSEEREFDSSSGLLHENCSNVYGGSHPIGRTTMHHSSSNCSLGNASLSGPYHNFSGPQVTRTCAPLGRNKAVGSETDIIPAFASSDNGGTSSYNSGDLMGNHDDSDSSLGTWGFACKRKALEVSSEKLCAGGSSSSNPRAENIALHNVPSHYNASSSLNIFLPSNAGVSEQANSRNGTSRRLSSGDEFPPSSVNGITESSTRNFHATENIANPESVSFGLPTVGATVGPSDAITTNVPPRHFSITSSSDLRHPLSLTMNSSNSANQPPSMASTSPPRSARSNPWNGSRDSRSGNCASSSSRSAESSATVRDETSFRSSFRNNGARNRYFSATETRNLVQDADNWNSAALISSQNQPSGSGIGPSSSSQTFPTSWDTNQNPTTSSHQRLSDYPWGFSLPAGSDPGSQDGGNLLLPSWASTSSDDPFSPLPWASTSTEEPVMSSRPRRRGNRQPYLRSTMTAEVSGDNHGPWRALASDFEGRHRVASEIREVLNAMRRSENFQAEDYSVFNPFINGVADSHDRHRDMRLDVDNMSYEELLALEERIGNVNTGLSEATILGSMKQRKYDSFCGGLSSDLEPCCICREEYVTADDIGTLGCGHEFHTDCIKQWLMLKNLCPICKTTGLET